jgi:serine O-acetyltransferase
VFHPSGIFIGPHVRIGRDCTLGPEIFIGANAPMTWDDPRDYPVIGDGVYLAPGAKILGRLSIGAGTRVGPNAVVMRTVPPKSIVAAPPCRVISADMWCASTTVEDRSAAADAHRAPET